MKKILFLITTLALFVGVAPASASLYSYLGGHLPPLHSQARSLMSRNCGVEAYKGTASQNIRLEACLRSSGQPELDQAFGAAIPITGPLIETSLQASIGSTDTTLTLVKGTDAAGNTLSGYYCFTIDSGTPSVEYVCGTVAGTAVSGLTRGISLTDGKTAVIALQFAHRRGADVRETDFPVITLLSRMLNGQESIPAINFYGDAIATSSFTSSTQIIDKGYADNLSFNGAPTASLNTKGISQQATDAMLQQSSSTGSTGAPTFANGGSFAQTSTSNKVPVSNGSGVLDPNWINTSTGANYNFGGAITINGIATLSTTTIATTTISQLNIPGIDVNSYLGTHVLYVTTTPVAVINTTASTTVFTATVPANTLNASNTIRVFMHVSNVSFIDSTAVTTQLQYGPYVLLQNIGVNDGGTNIAGLNGNLNYTLFASSTAQSQVAYGAFDVTSSTPGGIGAVTTLTPQRMAGAWSRPFATDSTAAQTIGFSLKESNNSVLDTFTIDYVLVIADRKN